MNKLSTLLAAVGLVATAALHSTAQNRMAGPTGVQRPAAGSQAPVKLQTTEPVMKTKAGPLLSASLSGYYKEDFESAVFPPAGWQIIDAVNPIYNWDRTHHSNTGLGAVLCGWDWSSFSGEDWLILPKFSVGTNDSLWFDFAVYYPGYPPDSTLIRVSTTDSAMASFTATLAILAEGLNYPVTAGMFEKKAFSLNAFAGQDIFIAIINKNVYGDGVIIDRVEMGVRPVVNVSALNIHYSNYAATSSSHNPRAVVANHGTAAQTFDVTCLIGPYTSTKTVTNLPGGTSQTVVFDPWLTPASPVNQPVTVYVTLPGDTYAEDDTVTGDYRVLAPFTNYGWGSGPAFPAVRALASVASVNSNDSSFIYVFGGISNLSPVMISNTTHMFATNMQSWNVLTNIPNLNTAARVAHYNNKIYLMGGTAGGNSHSTNRVYNIATNSWSSASPVPAGRSHYALGVYRDSLFYVMGGLAGSFVRTDQVSVYNASSDAWSTATPLPIEMYGHSAAVTDNKIVVAGGVSLLEPYDQATVYIGTIDPSNPINISWSMATPYPPGFTINLAIGEPLDAMPGHILFTGGHHTWMNGANRMSKGSFALDVNANEWKSGPEMITPVTAQRNFVPLVHNDSLYMVTIGGENELKVLIDVTELLNLGPYTMTVGMDQPQQPPSQVRLYPNPASEVVIVQGNTPVTGLEVVSITGGVMKHRAVGGQNRMHIDTSSFPPGMYVVIAKTAEGTSHLKFVKH